MDANYTNVNYTNILNKVKLNVGFYFKLYDREH